ncbi:MAG TPA: hypothetical protein VFZ98_01410 [Vicinamibacterales bacterium]
MKPMRHYTISETELESIRGHLRAIDDAAKGIEGKHAGVREDCKDIQHSVAGILGLLQWVQDRPT